MPKAAKATALPIPDDVKFTPINGDGFIRITKAARLASVHPVALEMSQNLLTNVSKGGVRFALATPQMKARAEDIQRAFLKDLRRAAKAFEPGKKIKTKCHRDGDALVFWYSA